MRCVPELLAPAGDWSALRAAVANGADAVYFGLEAFNARARAANFTVETLPEVLKFLHDRNVRGFVAFNTLIFSNELEEAERFTNAIAAAGADAVIVQDLGLVRLIKQIAPSLPVHASTQMTLTEPRGIEFVKSLGVERVVLARELSLEEIRKITSLTDMPVEVFVHGALCVAYSGQCLTSEALGGRSANRGQCAQACRMPYEMLVDGTRRDLGDKTYLLSPQDLAAYDWIKPLVNAGAISFKIEGRLKAGPYVAETTQTYRKAIDAAAAEIDFHLSRREELDLAQVFSRGLTPGWLAGNDHQKLVRGRFPKSRGIRLGEVVSVNRRGVRVRLAEDCDEFIRAGDGVLFDLGTPEVQEPAGRVWSVDRIERGIAELHFESLDWNAIPIGCVVWKTDDPSLRKKLEQSYSQDKLFCRELVNMTLRGKLGGEVELLVGRVKALRGPTVPMVNDLEAPSGLVAKPPQPDLQAAWPGPLEAALKRATTPDEIREQLARLGDTPFELGELALDLPDNVMIPKSILNDLRRRAIDELMKVRDEQFRHAIADENALELLRRSTKATSEVAKPTSEVKDPEITVLCRNLAQLDAVLNWKPALVYCDFEDLRNYKPAVEKAKAAGVPIGLAPLRIWKPGEDGFQSLVVRANPDAILVRNLASIDYFKTELPNAELLGDFSLNVANDLTARIFFEQNLQRLVPSFDLNFDQFTALMQASDPSRFEVVIHQHMPMFHMEHCVFAAFLSTGKDHRDCGRPCDRHKVDLRDYAGAEFPVLPDTGCRNTVFNSVPQSAAEYIAKMKSLGVRWFRIDLLRETPAEIPILLDNYLNVIDGTRDGRQTWRQLNAINQLGVTRGTLSMTT